MTAESARHPCGYGSHKAGVQYTGRLSAYFCAITIGKPFSACAKADTTMAAIFAAPNYNAAFQIFIVSSLIFDRIERPPPGRGTGRAHAPRSESHDVLPG